MILKNAEIFDKDFNRVKADIAFDGETITEIAPCIEGEGTDFSDCVILPGFIDIHTHGCAGYDATDGKSESVLKMSEELVKHGVTSFCPTTMTVEKERITDSFRFIKAAMGLEGGASINGINMEGPFISKAKKGAQAEENIMAPDIGFFRELTGICPVSLVDVAPETENAESFIKEASDLTVVSAAHTTADYALAKKAFDRGVTHITHLFNAMPPFLSREPGLPGAAFEDERVMAEMICDGIHIHPSVLRTAFRLLGNERSIVISDSMMAAGLPDGEYSLGGQTVFVNGGAATLADGTLAGSTANLFDEFKNLLKFGIDEKQAVRSCTVNPAKSIGIDDKTGSLAPGKNADILVLSADYSEIKAVFVKGKRKI